MLTNPDQPSVSPIDREGPSTKVESPTRPVHKSEPESGFAHPDRADTQVECGANGTLLQFEHMEVEPKPFGFKRRAMSFLESGVAKENSHGVLLCNDARQAVTMASVASEIRPTVIPGPLIPSTSETVTSLSKTTAASSPLLTVAASTGGGLLLAHGVTKALFGQSAVERLGGVSEANWGGQTLLSSAASAASSTLNLAAKTLGVVGGAIQVGLGLNKTGEGLGLLKNGDGEKVKSKEKVGLGLVDTAAGGSWILASLGVAPAITMPAFIALTVSSKAYQHRDKISRVAKRGLEKVKNLAGRVFQGAEASQEKISPSTERASSNPGPAGVP